MHGQRLLCDGRFVGDESGRCVEVAQEQAHAVLRVMRGRESDGAAAVVDVDEQEARDGESGRRARRWRRYARRSEGGASLVGGGDLMVHRREDLLHALFQGEGVVG